MDNDLIRDVYKQLGELTAKVDDIRSIRDTALSAQSSADRALQIAERNEDELKSIRADQANNRRWLVTTIITAVFNVIGIAITLVTIIL